jgi:hypothetical protein
MMMMVVPMMMVVVMMVMVVLDRRDWRGVGRRSRGLRHSVAGEAERENRRGGKALDHERTILSVVGETQMGSRPTIRTCA